MKKGTPGGAGAARARRPPAQPAEPALAAQHDRRGDGAAERRAEQQGDLKPLAVEVLLDESAEDRSARRRAGLVGRREWKEQRVGASRRCRAKESVGAHAGDAHDARGAAR